MRGARKAIAVGVAVAVACGLQKHLNFVPGPRHAAPVAAAAASMMMAPAAFADEIGDAAKKLGDASYSFAKEVDWNNGIFLQAPGKFQPLSALKAIDKMIEMGAAADPKLLKEAAEAHHKAIGSISGPNGVTSRADWDAVNAALGRVVASVPKAKVMAVYDSVKAITDPGVPAYMKSLVNGPDAEKAYQGFLEFKDVVEKNQVTTASAPAVVPSGDKIGEAAKALSDASYPFIKDIDWLSDIYLKPLPGKTAPETLKAGEWHKKQCPWCPYLGTWAHIAWGCNHSPLKTERPALPHVGITRRFGWGPDTKVLLYLAKVQRLLWDHRYPS